MTDNPTEAMLPVTQEDKDAAADLANALNVPIEEFTSSSADILVQAFARHRLASQSEREAVLEEAAKEADERRSEWQKAIDSGLEKIPVSKEAAEHGVTELAVTAHNIRALKTTPTSALSTDKDARIAELEAENARLTELLDELQAAETAFRWTHDYYGAGNRETGRAWDLMRRCGDNARHALKGTGNAD